MMMMMMVMVTRPADTSRGGSTTPKGINPQPGTWRSSRVIAHLSTAGFHSEFSQQELTSHSETQTSRFLVHFQLAKGHWCLAGCAWDPKHWEHLELNAGCWQKLTFYTLIYVPLSLKFNCGKMDLEGFEDFLMITWNQHQATSS